MVDTIYSCTNKTAEYLTQGNKALKWNGVFLFVKSNYDLLTEKRGSVVNMTDEDTPIVHSILEK